MPATSSTEQDTIMLEHSECKAVIANHISPFYTTQSK